MARVYRRLGVTRAAIVTPAEHNVDATELGRFAAMADRWWDPDGPCAPLHAINPLRLAWIERQAGDLAGRTVADVGCGGGILSEAMAERGANVVGIDLAADAIDAARAHAADRGVAVDYRVMATEDLAGESPRGFEVVTCMEMLEHVPHPDAVVGGCAQLLEPGGIAVFSTINRTPKAWLEAIVGAEYVLGLLPRGTHAYAQFIRPRELARWGRDAGLVERDATGLTYNPLSQRYRLCDAVDVNYMMALRLPSGDDDG